MDTEQIDREEFELRLKATFDWKNFCTDPLRCLVMADSEKITQMQSIINSCNERIDYYLTEYDNAPTPEEKMAVVGSVQGTLS